MSQANQIAVGEQSVGELFDRTATAHPELTALVDGPTGAAVTYRELAARVDVLARWLGAIRIGPGDRVATWAPNVPPVAAFTLAALRLGIAVTGVNPASTDSEVARQFEDAGVAAVLTTAQLADRAAALGVRHVLALGDTRAGTSLQDVLAPPTLARPAHDPAIPPVAVDADRLALLPYSSGTTGLPKGVMLTHRNLVAVLEQLRQRLDVGERDVTLAVAPFFHILGATAAMLLPLTTGATVVTMSQFDPLDLLRLLDQHRVTYLAVPPPVAGFLATHPAVDAHDLSALQLLASGGAPLSPDLQNRLQERLPDCAIGQGWGLTETGGAVAIPDRRAGAAPGTVGRPLPGTEVRAVDPSGGSPRPAGHDGELEVRGPQVMEGYLSRPTETAAILRPGGWLRTGDLGHLDPAGNVVIVDRLKDLIKVKGFQVAPTEIETELMAHPAVADAAVVGGPDERTGEVPVAFVVLRAALDGGQRHNLADWLRGRLAPYKQPAAIHVVDHLPRTPSGKLLRRDLGESLNR